MSEKLLKSAQNYEDVANELEIAVKHYREAAQHIRENEIPRGCAHAYAGWGHINKAEVTLKSESIFHAENSSVGLV